MKSIVYIAFIFVLNSVSAQSLYKATSNKKISYSTTEEFYVSFKKSMYGFEFKPNDHKLTPTLKSKIEQFMSTTNRQMFKGLGLFTLNILKRNNVYYVVEQKTPKKLVKI
jgi:hypothetical protein